MDRLGSREAVSGPRLRVGALGIVAVLYLGLAVVPTGALAFGTVAGGKTRYAEVQHVCQPPAPGSATCFALLRRPVPSADAGRAGVRPYTLHDGATQSGPAGGLTPAQLATTYGYVPTSGGSGETVAIVDAYDDPAIESDLAKFDSQYGIASCTQSNGCFTKVSQTGSTSFLPEADTSGWSVEVSLDVETVHAACPNCKVLLVEAKNPNFPNLAAAVNEAVSMGAAVVSNSYGGPEGFLGSAELNAFNHPGVVIAAATGDQGYYDWTELNEGFEPPGRPNVPAVLPTVVSVGGTSLLLDETGKRAGETVWNGNGPFDSSAFAEGASGGGCSRMFSAEPWQIDAPGFAATGCGGRRLAADVSAVADPLTGFDIYDSYDCGSTCEEFKRGQAWLTIGGTSLSTPLISSLYALAGGSGGVSYPALTLYGHINSPISRYDVVSGGNGICDDEGQACGANEVFEVAVDCEGTTACNAAPGYDGPSGVGAPNSLSLFAPLLPTAAIAPPGEVQAGSPATFGASGSSDPFPGGFVEGYVWSWGDGSPNGSGPSPTHTYLSQGEYVVGLTVIDNYGQSSHATSATIHVTAPAKEVSGGEEVKPVGGTGAGSAPTGPTAAPSGTVGVAGIKQVAVPAPLARLAGSTALVGPSGTFTIKIACPAGGASCSGVVTLRSLGGHSVTLASGAFKIPSGKAANVTLRLSRKMRALLVRSRTLRARASIRTGASSPARSLVTLRASRRHVG